MKKLLLSFPVAILLAFTNPIRGFSSSLDSFLFSELLLDLNTELKYFESIYLRKTNELKYKELFVDALIEKSNESNLYELNKWILLKLELRDEIELVETQRDIAMVEIRYRKGVELIRLMYEKILGLDHHFTGLHTYQHINVLSNPHSYPAFQKSQELLKKNKNKKYNMELPSLLQSNPFLSATYTMVSVLIGENNTKEKEEEMEELACILDFTVSMNADLNVIKNETEYLKNANQALKEDCERLFQEYTKPIEYLVQLSDTRTNDDWESLSNKLNDLIHSIQEEVNTTGGLTMQSSRQLVNLEFACQRVIDFITKYANFIGQGTQYYQKFDSIINSYQSETICEQQLPRQFSEMKSDIRSTIEKFENTYDLPELQGSRLKNLMFGMGE